MKKFVQELLTYDRILKAYPIYGTVRRYFIFLFGGGTAYFLAMIITTFLERGGMWFWAAYSVGLVFAIVFTFIYHRYVTFRKFGSIGSRFAKFTVVVLLIVIANWIFTIITISLLSGAQLQFGDPNALLDSAKYAAPLTYWLVTFFVTLVLSVFNFLFNKIWVFK
ncbi:GtrA family protein [Candidatus Woesearchaeota archaeon]|nr:GtrA family protein [Candidatus Woesearchaeota archaeon]